MSGVVPVVQADREAAAGRVRYEMRGSSEWLYADYHADRILSGEWDNHPLVQAFARHRIAETARLEAEIERLRAIRGQVRAAKDELAALICAECLADGGPQKAQDWPTPNPNDGECLQNAWDRLNAALAADTGEG